MIADETTLHNRPTLHRNQEQQVTVRPSTTSKANTAQLAIKGPEMTMQNNLNKKTNGLYCMYKTKKERKTTL